MLSMPVPQPSPARQWSTDAVAPGQRLDYWVGAICEAFLEMDCGSRSATAFEGRLTSMAVDSLSFNQVIATTQDVYRTPAAISRGGQQPFYLITQRDSVWHVRQGGHVAQLRAGDAVLVDSSQCYELHFPQAVACLSVQLPRGWVGQWLARVDCAEPRVAARDRGWGQALSSLCLQLAQAPELALGYPATLLSDQLGAMLAAALEPPLPPAQPAQRSLAAQARQWLQARLDDPQLSAERTAQALAVSVRTLHRAFAAEDTSFARSLRALRLARAAQLLAQPRLRHVTVAELGRRCGFADASHFVREFQQACGSTPARWRRERLPS